LTIAINMPHFIASYRLLYQRREMIERYRWAAIYVPCGLLAYVAVPVDVGAVVFVALLLGGIDTTAPLVFFVVVVMHGLLLREDVDCEFSWDQAKRCGAALHDRNLIIG
jgi:hypothetical protein